MDEKIVDLRTSQLLDEAIDLIIQRQTAPDRAVTQHAIAAWRERSVDHERIWQRVAEVHGVSGLASLQGKSTGSYTRRGLLTASACFIGVGSLGAWGVPKLAMSLRADHLTHTAELKQLELPGGTRITLGPHSALALSEGNPRHAKLLKGMAWFDVVPYADSPFVLDVSGGPQVRTQAASFDISLDAGLTSLAVASEKLSLEGTALQTLETGQWMRLHTRIGQQESGQRDNTLVGAWVAGSIIADAEPLESLVSKISRWLPERVIVVGEDVAMARISGIFDMTSLPERLSRGCPANRGESAPCFQFFICYFIMLDDF